MTVPVLFLLPSFYGRGMPSCILWGSPMWLILVLKCFLSPKWLECTNPPSQSGPRSLAATWTSTSFLWAVNRCTPGLFLPHAHIYYSFIIDRWPPGRQRRLSYGPGTFTILAHWPVSFFFFFVPSLSYWLLLNSFSLQCFSSLNFLHHCWISNLPIIDLLLEFRASFYCNIFHANILSEIVAPEGTMNRRAIKFVLSWFTLCSPLTMASLNKQCFFWACGKLFYFSNMSSPSLLPIPPLAWRWWETSRQ